MEASQPFIYETNAVRVIFGTGTSGQVAEEVERMAAGRALVVCTPNQAAEAQRIADLLGSLSAGVFAGAVMHVPVESAHDGVERARAASADCIVAIGGGSTTGLAKAIALETGLPILAIPT